MKKLLTTTALVALLGAAAAFAAETPITDQPTANDVIPDPNATPPAAQPDAMAPDAMTTPDSTAQPMDQSADPAMQSQEQVETPAPADTTVAAQPADKFLTVQADSEWLASNIIGASVYNPADENLGDVNDILVNDDGSVHAVIIGVGGFLGIGEKNVAVAFASLNQTNDADGNIKLVLNASKEELDAAAAFVTVAEQKRQEAQPAADAAPAPVDQTAPAPTPTTSDPAAVQ
ncbi:MAG: PRC-barrel domain-containing protein [Bauldia sp.]